MKVVLRETRIHLRWNASRKTPGASKIIRRCGNQVKIPWEAIQGVLFDLDDLYKEDFNLGRQIGTSFGKVEHNRCYKTTLVEISPEFNGGRPIDEQFFRTRISGRHIPDICQDLFGEWPEYKIKLFYEEKQNRFRELAGSMLKPISGLASFLAWVDSRGLRKGVVSNAPRGNTECMLKSLGLERYFEVVVLGDECARAKPYSDPYLKGLRLLNLRSQKTIAIEDSPTGIQSAVGADLQVIGLTTCQPSELLKAAGACAVFQDFSEILNDIEKGTKF